MHATSPAPSRRDRLYALACRSPSVFQMSQHEPSKPKPTSTLTPVSRLNGVSQSHQPPP